MIVDAKKPQWLNKKINFGECLRVKALLSDLEIHTVCQEAGCPNIGECFAKSEATFLILGKICTRSCSFCGVQKGKPLAVDPLEPQRIAQAASRLNLKHVVITSVTRDDLSDGGAESFIATISAIREKKPNAVIEVLIPDFRLNKPALQSLVAAKPDIIAHNIETVPRLYVAARQGASYIRSIEVLNSIKEFDKLIYTKSGIMLGLGEEEREVLEVFSDLRKVSCDFLSIGQYLPPGINHFPVKEYVRPEKFEYYKLKALELGFTYVASAPYVRSSYLASEYIKQGHKST